MSVIGCLPFVINGDIPHFADALFEMISGFTTTGATVVSDVEGLTKGSLFWRSFSHWIGGMGVLVFLLAIVPMAGGSHMNLMKAESDVSLNMFVSLLHKGFYLLCALMLFGFSSTNWNLTNYCVLMIL